MILYIYVPIHDPLLCPYIVKMLIVNCITSVYRRLYLDYVLFGIVIV